MTLTPEQLKAREGKITASVVGTLMNGTPDQVMNLWREQTGDPGYVPPDFSWYWPVRLGSFTEPFHLDWVAHQIGRPVTRRGEVVVCPTVPWAAATLDGWDAEEPCPVETKHLQQWHYDAELGRNRPTRIEDGLAKHLAQLHWQMTCCETTSALYSAIIGGMEPEQRLVAFDAAYAEEIFARAQAFHKCVETLTPPFPIVPVAPPTPLETMRRLDLEKGYDLPNWLGEWQELAGQWVEAKPFADACNGYAKALKSLVPDDCVAVKGFGISITRSRKGELSIHKA